MPSEHSCTLLNDALHNSVRSMAAAGAVHRQPADDPLHHLLFQKSMLYLID